LFDVPVPDADAVLINVIKNESEELPEPAALACLGDVCRPSAVCELCPDTLAVLRGVLNDDEFSEPFPDAFAALRFE
jgi:hypothetical protein